MLRGRLSEPRPRSDAAPRALSTDGSSSYLSCIVEPRAESQPMHGGARDALRSRGWWLGKRLMAMLDHYGALDGCTTAGDPLGAGGTRRASFSVTGLQMPTPSPTTADEDPPEARDVTRKLAHYVVATRFEDLPEGVRREVGRSLLNWMGVAVGASRHEAVEIALAAVTPSRGRRGPVSSVARSAST